MERETTPIVSQAERIPTMPQSERIPTMPQSERIPTMPQGKRIPTLPQDSRIATLPQAEEIPRGQNKALLHQAVSFVGACGNTITINAAGIVSADSGESQIYKCSRSGDDAQYVAKVLTATTPQSSVDKLKTRQKVISFLLELSRDPNSHILPLIDHGEVVIGGASYFVEVYPYCQGGDLGARSGEISYEELKEKIIPAMNAALHAFHRAGFVHRDIKPDNLYYYHDRVVLADFGISCDLRADGFATDRTKTGTLGYYAPELMSQAALTASDYYSMGQTLWTLYSGEMMYQNILRRYKSLGLEEQRNQINFAMLNDIYYGLDEIRPQDAFFEVLVRGLLQYSPSERFGHDEVARWLSGDKTLASLVASNDSNAVYPTPFKFNTQECWDNASVFDVLRKNWETGKNLLYSGTLKNFYASFDYGLSSEIDRIMKECSAADFGTEEEMELQNDTGLGLLLLQLNNYDCLAWRNHIFYSFSDISAAAKEESVEKDLLDLLASSLPAVWYKKICAALNAPIEENMVAAIGDIRYFAHSGNTELQAMALSTAQYLFAAGNESLCYEGCHTIAELIRKVAEKGREVCSYLLKLMDDADLYGFLYVFGCGMQARQIAENRGNDYADVESFFTLLANACTELQEGRLLAKCYRLYGPNSHFLWVKEHLSLYEFNGEATPLRAEIENCFIPDGELFAVREAYNKLALLIEKFKNLFVGNIYLAKLGLEGEKRENGITSTHLIAYWYGEFLGRAVPLGFTFERAEKEGQ